MSGPEVVLATEAAAATTTAAEAAAAAEAISAAVAAAEAEAAIIAAEQAAAAAAAEGATAGATGAELFGGGTLDPLQAAIASAEQEAAAVNAAQAYANAGMIDPFQQFLQYGYEDAPGSTLRSIQSGLANDPLNTLKSLPQFMGMPAAAPSAIQTMYGANMAKQMLAGSGKPQGTTTTTALRPGQQVNMTQPIASLLAPQVRRRRGISLI